MIPYFTCFYLFECLIFFF